MIPKRLHYVWVGSKLPDKQRAFIETWQRTNPDYELVEWNEGNIDLKLPAIARAYAQRRWATVADIARLIAVYEQGGIYLDTDFQVYRSLDNLLSHRCFFVFQYEEHPTDWVCNGVFGAEARHPFIGKAISAILQIRPIPLGLERPTRYGPKLITRLLREQGLRHYSPHGVKLGDIFVYQKTVFFPFAYGEAFSDSCIGDDTLAAHFWERSWSNDIPAPIRWAHSTYRWLINLHR
jgi:Glycosyltransferase sugar-binding region containing DXD motif